MRDGLHHILGLATAFLLASIGAALADSSEEAREQKLERLVRQDCGSCHGMTFKGGLGPDIRAERMAGFTPSAIAAVILDGVPGTPMPPWRGLLSEEDALWIAEYLRKGGR
ncbi:MAG: cytochrome c [Hyphomicrobium sp.]|nr:cytochrome c [Hyphomicrobium sp.]